MPPGVHTASLIELNARFGSGSAQRVAVTERLQHVLERAERTGQVRRVFVWGSYVTAKPEPGDVDIMLVMAADFRSEDCYEETQAIFDAERAENELGATVLWTREDVPSQLLQAFLDQWQVGRGGVRRGIVEVIL